MTLPFQVRPIGLWIHALRSGPYWLLPSVACPIKMIPYCGNVLSDWVRETVGLDMFNSTASRSDGFSTCSFSAVPSARNRGAS